MSLHATLHVNGVPIGAVIIQRISPDHPGPDTICCYSYELHANGKPSAGGRLEHRYGDGAWALVAAVVEDAQS